MNMARVVGAIVGLLLAGLGYADGSKIDAHAEVAAVLYAASATQAALHKSLDLKLKAQEEHIRELEAEVKSGDAKRRSEITAAQDSFVAELAAHDRQYAAQLAVFRATVNDIVATPEGARALARFNSGDEVGALNILDQLRAANERMRAEKAKLEDAEEGRRIARLALEARSRGKVSVDTVISRYEQVLKLDPAVADDWLQLERLYVEVGKLPEARKAVDSLAAAAHDDPERVRACLARAEVLLQQGDLPEARASAEQAVRITSQLLTAAPDDPNLRSLRGDSLAGLGEILLRQGDLSAAEHAYDEDVTLMRKLAAAPSSTDEDKNSLSSALLHLANATRERGEYQKALATLEESIALQRELSEKSPGNIRYSSHIVITLFWVTDLQVALGQFDRARESDKEIIATATRLSQIEPNTASFKSYLGLGFMKMAWHLRLEGDFADSRTRYDQARSAFHDLTANGNAPVVARLNEAMSLVGTGEVSLLLHDTASSSLLRDGVEQVKKIALSDPTDTNVSLSLTEALLSLAESLIAVKDFAGALQYIAEAQAVDKSIERKTGGNGVQRDTSTALLLTGRLLVAEGHLKEARVPLEKSLSIRRQLSDAQPFAADLRRDVAETMRSQCDAQDSPSCWTAFGKYVEAMKLDGVIWPADRRWLEEAHEHMGNS
jgi:tetratricopeptide (TPR) repeat protein